MALPAAAATQDKPGPPAWAGSAELSLVITAGNAASQTFGFGAALARTWSRDALSFKVSGIRTRAVKVSREAVGTADDFELREVENVQLSAESFQAAAGFDHRVDGGLLLQTGLSWERNRIAGIESRWVFSAGVGYALLQSETTTLKTGASLTCTGRRYTNAEFTGFSGLRATAGFKRRLTPTAELTLDAIGDGSLNVLPDWRGDMTASLSARISSHLALKTSLRWLYINRPASIHVPLFALDGLRTGTVDVPLEGLDTYFTTSLVLNL